MDTACAEGWPTSPDVTAEPWCPACPRAFKHHPTESSPRPAAPAPWLPLHGAGTEAQGGEAACPRPPGPQGQSSQVPAFLRVGSPWPVFAVIRDWPASRGEKLWLGLRFRIATGRLLGLLSELMGCAGCVPSLIVPHLLPTMPGHTEGPRGIAHLLPEA